MRGTSSDQSGSAGEESGVGVLGSGGSLGGGEFGETEVSSSHTVGAGSNHGVISDDGGLDNVDGVSSSTVSSSHFTVEHGHGVTERVGSVFLVHVQHTLSGLVLDDDSVVLDRVVVSLEDLTDTHDFSLSSSDLVLSLHLVPESGSGNDGVSCEHSDSVASRLRVLLTWGLATDNPVLVELELESISMSP